LRGFHGIVMNVPVIDSAIETSALSGTQAPPQLQRSVFADRVIEEPHETQFMGASSHIS
jgi:hypothetical protein